MTERVKAEDYKALFKSGRKRVKGAEKVEYNGIKFDSKRERDRYEELCHLYKAGEIYDLRLQVPINLTGQLAPILTETGLNMRYIADFVYKDNKLGGAVVVEDAKGFPTDVYKMKKAILAAMGIEVQEV